MDDENFMASPNRNHVLSKVVDDEAILINVSTGAYYSLSGVGCLVWQWIEKEKTQREMALELTRAYDVETETAAADIRKLLETMEKEGLITMTVREFSAEESPAAVNILGKRPYQSPAIDIFRDMQDLLALDPPMPGLRTIPWKTSDQAP
jgi:hypothetical protein